MPRLTTGLEQVFTNLGIVGSGYKLYFYQTGTTTPKTTYSNEALTIANTNPVILDAAGRPDVGIWGSDPALYRMVLGTPDSTIITVLLNPIVDVDPIDNYSVNNIAGLTPIPTAYWGTTAGTSTNYILDPALVNITSYSNQQTFFIDFHIACGDSPNIDINNLGTLDLKKYTGQGTKVALASGDVQVQRYIAINDGVDVVILNPEHPVNFPANTTTWRGLTYLPSQITIANNASDSNNDIDFSAGIFQFSDGSGQAIASALTKRLDAAWAAGTNQGGLDTGTKAANTPYYCYAIYNPATLTADALFSLSSTSPTLPSGYTKFRKIAALMTNGSSNIRAGKWSFRRDGSYDFFYSPQTSISESTDAVFTTGEKTITLQIPVNATPILAILIQANGGAATQSSINYYSTNGGNFLQTIVAQGGSSAPSNFLQPYILVTDRILRYTSSVNFTSTSAAVYNNGWIDNNF